MHNMAAYFPIIEISAMSVAAAVIILYLTGVYVSKYKKNRPWQMSNTLFFVSGILTGLLPFVGHLGESAHQNFTAHMMGHLLLGMLAPVLVAFGRPVTLLMRTLPTKYARKISIVMRSWFIQLITNPVTAAILNIGGLYMIYMTGLFHLMHTSAIVFILLHLHVFLAGYLFTVSIINVDLKVHRYSFIFRAAVLVTALGFHKALSKFIYAGAVSGFPSSDREQGAMLMYYGGDIIDLFLIIVLCNEWYRNRLNTEPLSKNKQIF